MLEYESDFAMKKKHEHILLSYLYNDHSELDGRLKHILSLIRYGTKWNEELHEDLHRFLQFLQTDFRRHIMVEDDILFFTLTNRLATLEAPLLLIKSEHDRLLEISDRIGSELNQCVLQEQKTSTMVCLLKQFDELFEEHTIKEDRVLYPMANQLLTLAEKDILYQTISKHYK
ncbi:MULTISPECIES: cation-binding protein [Brevibacillus]|uniref:cation-binding protein n=1 Tax=Brevibacillus TaxID=55080 RepID=UPI000370A759|nr:MULTISPECIES: cation-binding protein [Brevibacillus]ATO51845.1 cation-binding protein [Brevibacillus laterosporus DSM 25]AYB37841.1 cation-binding protein [Brevibacillus laterosporus]MBG9774803.1 cation-binding protein [Brevibacillus laterosporus]MBG9789395.1 cation-binding protein [Brevibacillus laterosporus]MBG9798832.1 cation-binding protein [Brevibacillus laterosporus]